MVGTPLASDGFGLAFGPPSSRSTLPLAASCCARSASPGGVSLAGNQGPSSDEAASQPSNTCRYQVLPWRERAISACVLITRSKREPATERMTGLPSIGTRIAGL
ncbi:MAG: hypothetical protein AW07_03548 [Candidatus Accumulibacter sp. SK-11]|nr:MAG: hypothetical protein AW07_03548 [Candidatus Accumulibacter sp. SK-11]